jgi:hypothetical protein
MWVSTEFQIFFFFKSKIVIIIINTILISKSTVFQIKTILFKAKHLKRMVLQQFINFLRTFGCVFLDETSFFYFVYLFQYVWNNFHTSLN